MLAARSGTSGVAALVLCLTVGGCSDRKTSAVPRPATSSSPASASPIIDETAASRATATALAKQLVRQTYGLSEHTHFGHLRGWLRRNLTPRYAVEVIGDIDKIENYYRIYSGLRTSVGILTVSTTLTSSREAYTKVVAQEITVETADSEGHPALVAYSQRLIVVVCRKVDGHWRISGMRDSTGDDYGVPAAS